MFSNVGWGEILVLLVVTLLFIGPERLPGLIKELRAVLLAIRTAVGQARQQLDDEFGDEMKSFAEPLAELNNVRRMGARGFITKTLFDGDDSYLTPLDDAKSAAEALKRTSIRDLARNPDTKNTHKLAGVPSDDTSSNPGRDVDVPDGPGAPATQRPEHSDDSVGNITQDLQQPHTDSSADDMNSPKDPGKASGPGGAKATEWDDIM